MYIIITLLASCQSSILSSNEWHNDMNPAFISTIMAPSFKIEEITLGMRRTIPIPNENTSGCPRGQRGNPNNVAQHINGNGDLENMQCILRIPKVNTRHPTDGSDGHGVREMGHEKREMGTMIERIRTVGPPNFLDNMVKVNSTCEPVWQLPLVFEHVAVTPLHKKQWVPPFLPPKTMCPLVGDC